MIFLICRLHQKPILLFSFCLYSTIMLSALQRGFLFGRRRKRMREHIVLVCSECQARNYETTKKKGDGKRREARKFCPRCGKYTIHKEGK